MSTTGWALDEDAGEIAAVMPTGGLRFTRQTPDQTYLNALQPIQVAA